MPRKRRPLNRESGVVRDASLIVIASEDTYAVKQYFSRFRTERVQFYVLPTEDNHSAPQHVMTRLDDYKKEFLTDEQDTFWICIDRDRWDEASLSNVLRQCADRGYGVALSNPCFELWLILHYSECPTSGLSTCSDAKNFLRGLMGGYGRDCCRTFQITQEMVEVAIRRARSIEDRAMQTPQGLFTHVHKILDDLLAKQRLNFI